MASLSFRQQDALREIGSIGAGHAANSLAALLQTKVAMTQPTMRLSSPAELWHGFSEQRIVAVHMEMTGDAAGNILIIFDRVSALEFAAAFVRRVLKTDHPSDADIDSTLQEFANIIAGSYLMALTSLTGLNLALTSPAILKGTAKEVLTSFPSLLSDPDAILIESQFLSDQLLVPGSMILIPDEESALSLVRPLSAKANFAL